MPYKNPEDKKLWYQRNRKRIIQKRYRLWFCDTCKISFHDGIRARDHRRVLSNHIVVFTTPATA